MPGTALQAILTALVSVGNKPPYRIITTTPDDEACTIVNPLTSRLESMQTLHGEKVTIYECENGKGSKIQFDSYEEEYREGRAHLRGAGHVSWDEKVLSDIIKREKQLVTADDVDSDETKGGN